MSGSFEVDNGRIIITTDGRLTTTTDGTLVNLLPPANDYVATLSAAYPDFEKDWAYNWQWKNRYADPVISNAQLAEDCACISLETVPPQEWSSTTSLVAAPAGADIFVGRVRLNRTVAPTHSWGDSPVDPLPPMNVWIPLAGSLSALLEAEVGMARALSIYIADGTVTHPGTPGMLTLLMQQSVSVAPGGGGSYGEAGFNFLAPSSTSGGEWVFGSKAGVPVRQINAKGLNRQTYTSNQLAIAPIYNETHRRGGADPCSVALSTSFASTYQVEIVGKFGRRS